MDCQKCPRLQKFLQENKEKHPDFFNAPVPNFGDKNAEFLIVGLAPGLCGANKTGRPFTADFCGDLLYNTLLRYGFASGEYKKHANDGLKLINTMITNAVKCVPPANKPTNTEICNCNTYLKETISSMHNLKLILSLGRVSHNAVLKAFELKQSTHPFQHGRTTQLSQKVQLIDSYHCSLYNTATKRLTQDMFNKIFQNVQILIKNTRQR